MAVHFFPYEFTPNSNIDNELLTPLRYSIIYIALPAYII